MPDWLQSVIPGDAAKTVGIEWSPAESERLARVLRAKTERHNRKFELKTLRGKSDMKHKDKIIEVLKSGPQTTGDLSEKTGIATSVLYATLSGMSAEGLIDKENIDGGRGRRYSLRALDGKNETPRYAPAADQQPAESGIAKLPPRPELRKKLVTPSPEPASIGMFKPGDKFLIVRNAQHVSVLATTLGMVTIGTGQQIQITAEESASARPIVRLRAEVVQAVEL